MFSPRVFYQSPRLRGAMTEIEAQAYACLTDLERSLSSGQRLASSAAPPAAPPPRSAIRVARARQPLLH